jgi:hypothetical protein
MPSSAIGDNKNASTNPTPRRASGSRPSEALVIEVPIVTVAVAELPLAIDPFATEQVKYCGSPEPQIIVTACAKPATEVTPTVVVTLLPAVTLNAVLGTLSVKLGAVVEVNATEALRQPCA